MRRLPASRWSGARSGWDGQPRCTAVTVVKNSQPQRLAGLDHKGRWSGPRDSALPWRRCCTTGGEAGPHPPWDIDGTWEACARPPGGGPSQEGPMREQVKAEGASEGRPVMGRRGVGTCPPTQVGRLPSGLAARERAAHRWRRPSTCRRWRRSLVRSPLGRGSGSGSVSCRCVSIGCRTASSEGRLQGSSCMRGNAPVQFLGEGVVATPSPYPTDYNYITFAQELTLVWVANEYVVSF